MLPRLSVPLVYTYCYAKHPSSPISSTISYDDYQGAKLAAECVIGAGHSKIAIASGVIDSYPTYRRMMGYQTALMEHGASLNPEYILSGNWTYESGRSIASRLFSLDDPPTAVLAMNDMMAFGIIDWLKERGVSVPGDVAVHGFDGLETARYFSPPLTTISLPLHEIGKKSAETLIRLAKVGKPGEEAVPEAAQSDRRTILIPCKHVRRSSV
jgi:LacI family transcriptional regulator